MKKNLFSLKQLRAFIYVARFSSFTQAAHFLGAEQSALSRQVRRLEVSLGKTLFIRTGRGVALTQSGRILLADGEDILKKIDKVTNEITMGELSGSISVGLPPTITRFISVPLIQSFRKQLPNVNLVINEGLTSAIEKSLINNTLDFGVLYNSTETKNLDLKPLAKEDLFLISFNQRLTKEENNTISFADASKRPLILPSYPNTYRTIIEIAARKNDIKLNIAIEHNSIGTILDLVLENLGHAILSSRILHSLHDDYRKNLLAQRIVRPNLISHIYVGIPKNKYISERHKIAYQLLSTTIQSEIFSCLKSGD